MKSTKIALVQMQATFGNIDKNLSTLEKFINEAAAQQAEIICFPEMCIQGYSREIPDFLLQSIDGEAILFLKKLAQNKGITIIAGMAEKCLNKRPFITQVVIRPGQNIDYYRKTHLGNSEQPYYQAGNEIKTFSTEKTTIGIQICWDTHFPEMTTILSLRGAEVIFAPHASPTIVGDRKAIWLKYLAARAYDNSVFLAACNLVGDDGNGRQFCGGSMVIDPKGNVLAEDFEGKQSMLVVDLDCAQINAIRERKSSSMANSFFLANRRPEIYKDLLRIF
ncbi:Nitrilase/cyanide hydratase and apolipoprotein N-acyltransferase [Desulforamulus reducens MI-1]|uniref:Nitrilase/cyanide hydratase and apolipoprotein N-acyltransferase n=1 Tax=Desulforamulus reducens (strain ATCC BAA-1160 / DSM 100696 / MI-1) TaxID=349161 RepID=A4J6K3_DESRM|nr:nitrilase family protein [Desulforamulus reducens]ABO50706.1 Nitrilase/cyanide hydratase and apolipoprotein N-acyltransferase [Desulforamulus reducens MI-1]